MRKNLKMQLINMLRTLEHAECIFKQMCENKNEEMAVQLLNDMYASALTVSDVIVKKEEECRTPVMILQEYCDLLLLCQKNREMQSWMGLCENLGEKRRQAYDSVMREILIRWEILFLPYKTSMWDSLESVWKAAREDSSCDCRVVSVPYFDRKPDGTLGEMHNESMEYPDYVPMTDYLEYDIKEERPDVIFIHNPYDQYNLVTSVHPAYYSSELKKHTDLLVYIPYYITMGDVPENYCLCPGVLNADKVIVQSKEVRDTYIRVISKAAGITQQEAVRSRLYDKILPLGSPKIDKVLNTGPEDIILPGEWARKIYGISEESL